MIVDVLIMIGALHLVVVASGKEMLAFDSWFANRERARTRVSSDDDGGVIDS